MAARTWRSDRYKAVGTNSPFPPGQRCTWRCRCGCCAVGQPPGALLQRYEVCLAVSVLTIALRLHARVGPLCVCDENGDGVPVVSSGGYQA